MNKLKAFWASLPHPVQAGLILFATTAGTTLAHAIEESFCFSTQCLKHYAASAIVAGVVAVRAFYMLPNGSAQLVAQAKAENEAQKSNL